MSRDNLGGHDLGQVLLALGQKLGMQLNILQGTSGPMTKND